MKKIVCLIMIATVAMACGSQKQKSNSVDSAPQRTMVGGDRDEHGCLRSAGYTWSEVRKDCIRPWEEGMKFVTMSDPQATQAAYAVFSRDSSKVEVFLPGRKPFVLPRGNGSAPAWTWINRDGDAVMNMPSRGWMLVNSQENGRAWLPAAK